MSETLKSLMFGAAFVLAGVCFQLIVRFDPIRFYSFWIPLTLGILLKDPLINWLKAMKNKNSPPSS